MTTARTDILATIRRSLGVTGSEAPRQAAVADRLARAPRGVVPARGQAAGAERVALFAAQARLAQASLATVATAADVPTAVAQYLRESNLPATLRRGADGRLAAMPWAETALECLEGASAGDDLNGLSYAFGAVAETGTLALVSGADNPTTLNFLPDNHIVVVDAGDIDGDFETLLARTRAAFGKGLLPRSVNLITGPSRSADIEQTLLLGAHGPRRLHILVVGTPESLKHA